MIPHGTPAARCSARWQASATCVRSMRSSPMSGKRDRDLECGARRQSRSDRDGRADLADEPGRRAEARRRHRRRSAPIAVRTISGSVTASGTSAGSGFVARHENDAFVPVPADDRRREVDRHRDDRPTRIVGVAADEVDAPAARGRRTTRSRWHDRRDVDGAQRGGRGLGLDRVDVEPAAELARGDVAQHPGRSLRDGDLDVHVRGRPRSAVERAAGGTTACTARAAATCGRGARARRRAPRRARAGSRPSATADRDRATRGATTRPYGYIDAHGTHARHPPTCATRRAPGSSAHSGQPCVSARRSSASGFGGTMSYA